MANPNLLGITNIRGFTDSIEVTTTETSLPAPNTGANRIFKYLSLVVSNIGTTNQTLTVRVRINNGTPRDLIRDVTVPPGSSIIIVNTANPIYIDDNNSVIRIQASANGVLDAVFTYEELY